MPAYLELDFNSPSGFGADVREPDELFENVDYIEVADPETTDYLNGY